MAIIKKFASYQNLTNFQTFLIDDNPLSDYFRITEFKDTFTGGKNGFLIEGSEFLKETTEIKVEVLDVNGNPVYYEPGDGNPEYYEGLSKLVAVHVYDDTPIGLGKITILGELKEYVDRNGITRPVPKEWQGVYNVKWERTFKINRNLPNEDIVRFYKRPIISIEEIVKPIFNKTIPTKTISGSVSGIPQQPAEGTNLTNWRAGTFYKLVKSTGSWDIDIDENPITVSVDGNTYTPTIIEVLNEREVLVDVPYTSNNIVQSFSSQSFTASYQDLENEVVGDTPITGSFAKIDMYQLKTFVGDVARVKIFRKSRNQVNDFQLVQESKLESTELLRDIYISDAVEIPYGRFSTDVLNTYWETSSIDHPTTINSAVLSQAVKVDYDSIAGGVQKLITKESFSLAKDVEYTLSFRTQLSGSVSSDKYVKAYFSGSYTNNLGNPASYIQNFMHVSGSDIYKTRQNVSQNILAERDINAKLVFEFYGDDWYVSNVSLRNAQETSFSPDEFTLIQDIPRKLERETFDFRFEFYDINNNYIPVDVTATKEFDGGNDFSGGTSARILTFESDRNAFRFLSGSIANPENQQILFQTTKTNLSGSITFESQAFDIEGNLLTSSSYAGGQYPGLLTQITPSSAIVTLGNFTGSRSDVYVGSIVYTASCEDLQEFETVYRLEDGDNAPQLIVTSNANQFIYEPTTLSPKPSGQSITIRAQRKNLASLVTPLEVNSGSDLPPLNYVNTANGIDTYTISALDFSASFAQTNFDEVTYSFTGSDVFGNNQTDEITLSKVINFDGVSIVLSNESTTFPAKSTGEIVGTLDASSGSVQMFIGGTQIQHAEGLTTKNRFDIISVSGTNVIPYSSNPTNANYSINSFETTKDSGSLTLNIKYLAGDSSTSQSFQKVVSYTKAKKGVPTVLTKTSPTTQTINSSSLGFEIPQTVEVIVQEGGDEYVYDSGLSSPSTFKINDLGYTAGSASFQNEIITLHTGSGAFNGLIGSASIDYIDSEGTTYSNKIVRFDLSVSKIGKDGINGSSGSDAQVVRLNANQYVVEYNGDGVKTPVAITLEALPQNFDDPYFEFVQNETNIRQAYSTVATYAIPDSQEPGVGVVDIWQVNVKEGNTGAVIAYDNIDIFGLKEGSNAFTTFLTNEAHVFPANSNGVVTGTIADGSFQTRMFRGTQQYHFDDTVPYDTNSYRISNVVATGITVSQSTVGTGTSAQRKFTPTAVGADEGTVTLNLIDNETGTTFDKTYTFSISKKGVPTVNISASPQAQTIISSSGVYGTPQDVQIIVSEGGDDYTYDSTSPYGNKTFRITNEGNGTDNDDGTITPPAVTNDNGYTETIILTYKNSEGDEVTNKSVTYNVGVAIQGDPGEPGPTGSIGPTGITGPGVVHTGVWEVNRYYQFSDGLTSGTGRRDTVLWSSNGTPPYDTYYASTRAHQAAAGNVADGAPHETSATGWISLGQQDFFVAAKIGIFEDSYVHKTLNIGTTTTGSVSSANITLAGGSNYPYFSIGQSSNIGSQGYGVGNGIFIGRDSADGNYKASFENGTNAYLKWNGTSLEIKGDITVTNTGDFADPNAEPNDPAQDNPTQYSFGPVGGPGFDLANVAPGSTPGLYFGGSHLGYHDGSNWSSYLSASGDFYLGGTGGALVFESANGNLSVTGQITAESGNFNGFMTVAGGTMKIGKDVSGTNDGIYINSNNYWYSTGNFKVGDASENMSFSGGSLTVTGDITANNLTANTAGTIGGWEISSNQLESPDGRLVLSTTPFIGIYDTSSDLRVQIATGALSPLTTGTATTLPALSITSWNSPPSSPTSGQTLFGTTQTFTPSGTGLYSGLIQTTNSSDITICNWGPNYYGQIKIELQLQIANNSSFTSAETFSISIYDVTGFGTNTGTAVVYANSSAFWEYNFQSTGTHYARINLVRTVAGSPAQTSGWLPQSVNTSQSSGATTVNRVELTDEGFQVVRSSNFYFKVERENYITSTPFVQVGGDLSATGNVISYYSDKRLKNILGNIENPLDKLNKLNGIYYKKNELAESLGMVTRMNQGKTEVGLIAQEVEEVLPEVVHLAPIDMDSDTGQSKSGENYLTVDYSKVVPLLVESIKELNKKVDRLEEENRRLRDAD